MYFMIQRNMFSEVKKKSIVLIPRCILSKLTVIQLNLQCTLLVIPSGLTLVTYVTEHNQEREGLHGVSFIEGMGV